jgi:hypothetical protein
MAGSNQGGMTAEEYRAEHAPPGWLEILGDPAKAGPNPFAPRPEPKRKTKSTADRMAAAVHRAEVEREAEREKLAKAQRRQARRLAREREKYAGMSTAEVHAARAQGWGEQES